MERPSAAAAACLVIGAILGLAGSFAASASMRGLAWGVDGIALIVAAALLFAATALQVFAGRSLNPLSRPPPFFAYPVLVFTLFGWAWWCRRPVAGN